MKELIEEGMFLDPTEYLRAQTLDVQVLELKAILDNTVVDYLCTFK